MAFTRPTLSELVTRIQADLVSRLNLNGAVLRRSMVYVLARVLAGAAHMLHGHLEFLSRQIFPDLSEAEYLVRHGALFGQTKTPAVFATGTVQISGAEGESVPAGTVFVRGDGSRYTADALVTIDVTLIADVSLTAVEAGVGSTLAAGESVSFESPIAGIDATATATASTVDGTDEETDEDFRVRLLAYLREPAHGGTEPDYIAWAKTVSGVTRVWVEPQGLGAGTVVVRFVRDDDVSIVPSAGEVSAVQTVIDAEKPAHADVTVVAPTTLDLDPDITITPDTADVRAAIEAELTDLLYRETEPAGTIYLSAIRTAIGNAAGLDDFTLNDPVANVTTAAGEILVLGTATY